MPHSFNSDPDRAYRRFVNADTRAPERDDDLGSVEGDLSEDGGEE